jgi:Sulfotransferase domain
VLEQRFAGVVEDWEDYCRLFAGAGEGQATGEATPCYLWSKTAARRIADCVPGAKIIIILRNPADRAFSQHLQTIHSGGYSASFRQHIEASLAGLESDQISFAHPLLAYGLYAEQVQRYLDRFPAEQIGLWLYEDTRQPGFLREVFEFLGVDGGFVADTSQRHLEQRVPRMGGLQSLRRRWNGSSLRRRIPARARAFLGKMVFHPNGSIKMTREDRGMLIDFYREDVLRLEAMIGRDLSAWL